MRTYLRGVEEAIEAGNAAAAVAAMKLAEPELAKAKQRGVIHANTAARKISRLVRRIRSISA
jgi:small subunit ribosomal protein S20